VGVNFDRSKETVSGPELSRLAVKAVNNNTCKVLRRQRLFLAANLV
jgi:hypothetical protein